MNDVSDTTAELVQTSGQILKAAREARKVSIGEIAQRLLLSKNTIIALEQDDYSKIPAPVYAEGYLKAYAQFLQIPIDAVLASFRSLNIYPVSEIKTQINVPNQPSKSQELPKLENNQYKGHAILGAFAILILGILAVFIGKQFFGKSTEVIHEVIHVPNNSANQNDQDSAISDNQMPIITTSNSKNVVIVDTDKPDAQNVSLMLDTGSTADKSGAYSEPNLILTKPKSASTE